jgi:hypothetical protein
MDLVTLGLATTLVLTLSANWSTGARSS